MDLGVSSRIGLGSALDLEKVQSFLPLSRKPLKENPCCVEHAYLVACEFFFPTISPTIVRHRSVRRREYPKSPVGLFLRLARNRPGMGQSIGDRLLWKPAAKGDGDGHRKHMMKMVAPDLRSRPRSVTAVSRQATRNCPAWKRTLDVVFIAMAAPTVAPFMGLIALYVKCVSKGPVFFKQERVGYRGSTFICYKFRSMQANAEVKSHKDHTTQLMGRSDLPMVKMDAKGDSRLIPMGVILRATGLDELPQLWNVLRGEMSLVGPRPCVPYEYEQYQEWQKRRFDVVPGLTGLWQVSGKNLTTFNEMIKLDLQYAESLSMWLDIKIILKTIPALVQLAYRMKKLKGQAIYSANSEANQGPMSANGSEK